MVSICSFLAIRAALSGTPLSLEVGKKATFFVSAGNALDMISNDVLLIFFDGQSKSTSNFQKELYLRYKHKYEGE